MEKEKKVAKKASKDENIKKVSKTSKTGTSSKGKTSSKPTGTKKTGNTVKKVENSSTKRSSNITASKKVETKKDAKESVKEIKKNESVKRNDKPEKIKFQTSEQEEFKSLLIVILVVIICVAGIYVFTRAFVTKDLFKKDETTEEEVTAGSIDYEVAIMGQILNRPYDEYYVVIYDKEDGDYVNDMYTLTNSYSQLDNHLHMYVVDLSNEMNKQYYDPENVNTGAKSLSEMKVGDITLLKIKKGAINKYIVDYSKMESELGLD